MKMCYERVLISGRQFHYLISKTTTDNSGELEIEALFNLHSFNVERI